MSPWKIFHNPRCSKSRQTLQILKDNGIDANIVEYLQTPLTEGGLVELSKQLGCRPKDFIRKKEGAFKELNLNLEDDQAVFQAIVDHPILMERPIVVHNGRAVIGRPPENVQQLFK